MTAGQARNFSTASARWAGVGPYYAMFPSAFTDAVVSAFTRPGEGVLDPFAGRGTAVFSASTLGRVGLGMEINPVGYVYGQAKLRPARAESVVARLTALQSDAGEFVDAVSGLPPFFHACFSSDVLQFLLAARARLNWRSHGVDRTVMAFLLVYLHGKEGSALSNQMRQTKAMSPQYAMRWWASRGSNPPEMDPLEFLTRRVRWRYARGRPDSNGSRMLLGDCRIHLRRVAAQTEHGKRDRIKLVLTSPPYYGVTNYHYDQWLRLWLLGGPPNALLTGNGKSGKFESRIRYRELLDRVFQLAARGLAEDGVVYVRTHAKAESYEPTVAALRASFPGKRLTELPRPAPARSQTQLFGGAVKPSAGEVDLVLTPGKLDFGVLTGV